MCESHEALSLLTGSLLTSACHQLLAGNVGHVVPATESSPRAYDGPPAVRPTQARTRQPRETTSRRITPWCQVVPDLSDEPWLSACASPEDAPRSRSAYR